MIKVTFPDGAVRDYARGTTGTTVVEGISPSLAKKTVAMKWNGTLTDLSDPLNDDGRIERAGPDEQQRADREGDQHEHDEERLAPGTVALAAFERQQRNPVEEDRRRSDGHMGKHEHMVGHGAGHSFGLQA